MYVCVEEGEERQGAVVVEIEQPSRAAVVASASHFPLVCARNINNKSSSGMMEAIQHWSGKFKWGTACDGAPIAFEVSIYKQITYSYFRYV